MGSCLSVGGRINKALHRDSKNQARLNAVDRERYDIAVSNYLNNANRNHTAQATAGSSAMYKHTNNKSIFLTQSGPNSPAVESSATVSEHNDTILDKISNRFSNDIASLSSNRISIDSPSKFPQFQSTPLQSSTALAQ